MLLSMTERERERGGGGHPTNDPQENNSVARNGK